MRFSSMNPSFNVCAAVACTLLTTSCKRPENVVINEVREISTHARKAVPDIPSATRFYADAEEEPAKTPNVRDFLAWTVPPGWQEVPPDAAGMRLLNLTFGPNGEGECYISFMPGSAGGLEANVNRWRTQMGQPPYTPEELAQLSTKPFLGREATYVAFDGDFKGFGAEQAKQGYRLLGVIHSASQATMFVKLTGPKALVEENSAAFDAFCQSIRPNTPEAPNPSN